MESKLIKILEKDFKLDSLNEENIAEYVQTKQSIERLKKFAINPFEEIVKEAKKHSLGDKIFYGADLSFNVESSEHPTHYSAKEILTLSRAMLGTSLQNQELGKQMYGVRKFGNDIAIDTAYYLGLINDWQNAILGTNIKEKVVSETSIKSLSKQYPGITALIDKPIIDSVQDLSNRTGILYLAAKEQVKNLSSRIINPFENAFKELSSKDPEKTTRDYHVFGGLSVFVKTVPRYESNNNIALENLTEILEELSEQRANGGICYFNKELVSPRPYASITGLIEVIDNELSEKELKYRQELSVLYKPEEAMIVSR